MNSEYQTPPPSRPSIIGARRIGLDSVLWWWIEGPDQDGRHVHT